LQSEHSILILGAAEVEALTRDREHAIVEAVRRAYLAHGGGKSSLPHSTFLRFPGDAVNRIIALPAYLGDGFELAGMKWIASFPGNLERGLPRASAVMVLNSCESGLPTAILEGSLISAQRTAASAALAARELVAEPPRELGLVGTGPVNRQVARFVRELLPSIERLVLFDRDRSRAEEAAHQLGGSLGLRAEVAADLEALLARCPLTCFATNAVEPHVNELSACRPGSTILHVSLRDLAPAAILACDNVVDDVDHVSRAGTSIHLAEQSCGHRRFVRATLAEVLAGSAPPRREPGGITVFSPFGLGILDLAVGQVVIEEARARGVGLRLEGFLPAPVQGAPRQEAAS
jgi:2,3-diaminopropionate biosynthesis protein SbnB